MVHRSIVLITLFVTATACARNTPTEPGEPGSPSELRSTPTTISTDGRTLRLDAELWRDFMPVSPPNGKPLTVIARVTALGGAPVPPTVRATEIVVVQGEEVWRTAAREERSRAETAPAYEIVGRDGPKWSPGTRVDVIVVVTNGSRTWHLRAPSQVIAATH